MKKILILLLISVFAVSGAFAEIDLNSYLNADGNVDFDLLLADPDITQTDLIPIILESDQIDNIDFGAVMPGLDTTQEAELTAELKAQGYDATIIEEVLIVASAMAEGKTLKEIKADPNIDFDSVENALVEAIAKQTAGTLMDDATRQKLEETLDTAGSMISVLNGFAQSTANSSVSSSLFGYQGYKLFVASFGMLGAFAVPEPLDTAKKVIRIEDKTNIIEELKAMNIEAGVTVQGFSASFGLNLSWLIDKLYVGAVLGSTSATVSTTNGFDVQALGSSIYKTDVNGMPFKIPKEIPSLELSMGSSVYGIKLNYQFIRGFGIPILFRWNGLSLGTGFIANNMYINADIDLSGQLNLPKDTLGAQFSITSDTYTIPLEVSTGIQFLSILTITGGASLDVQFGTSNVEFDILTSGGDGIGAKIMRQTIDELLSTSDTISFPYDAKGDVQFINPRINIGVGIGLGPVILDVSAFYYINTGLALGANVIIRI